VTIAWFGNARVVKELRALLPAWALCLASIAAMTAIGRAQILGVAAYWLGAVALGALSMGQEYNARTLSLLLSQPTPRDRIYLEKLAVLAVLLAALGAAIIGVVAVAPPPLPGADWRLSWGDPTVVLPLLCAFCLAPWLTMVCRGALAGMVFAGAVPAVMWIAAEFASAIVYGGELSQVPAARELTRDIFIRGTLIASALAAAAGWWQFQRLEAIQTRSLEIRAPFGPRQRLSQRAATRSKAVGVGGPLVVLLEKELKLQQLTYAVSGLYVVGWIVVVLLEPLAAATRTALLYTLTIFHSGAVPLLAGSLASAEERQLGTIPWQMLLPMAAWKQWTAKAAVVLSVALTLTLVVPALLLAFTSSAQIRSEIAPVTANGFAFAIVAVAVTSLYVSSLCGTGLHALLISMPIALLMMVFPGVRHSRWYATLNGLWQFPLLESFSSDGIARYWWLITAITLLGFAGALLILLRAALANHRSAERGAGRVWKQMAGLVAFLIVVGTLWSGAYRLYARAVDERMREWRQTRAELTGVVVDDSDRPVTDFVVKMFFAAGGTGHFNIPGRNSSGEFKLNGLPPGEYIVVAVKPLVEKMEREPQVLGRLREMGTAVTLAAGETRTLTLTLADF
jgi:hypothetical protein